MDYAEFEKMQADVMSRAANIVAPAIEPQLIWQLQIHIGAVNETLLSTPEKQLRSRPDRRLRSIRKVR